MFGGQAVTWTLTAVTLALLPRYLGPADMGRISIGMAFAQLTMTVAGLGIATLVTREVARRREAAMEVVATAFWLCLSLGSIGALVTLGISLALGYEAMTWAAIAVFAATVPFDLLTLFGFGVLQGFEVMRYHAIWDVANKLFLLCCLVLVVVFDLGLPAFLVASFLSASLTAAVALRLVRRFAPFPFFGFSLTQAKWVLAESVPIGAVNVVLIVYLSVDVILLSRFSGEAAAGLYAAPMRLFGTMLFAPTILMTVLFPRLAATAMEDGREFGRLSRNALKVLTGVTVLAAVFAVFPGRVLLVKLFGEEFSDSGSVFAMMAIALVPTSINVFAHRVLVALDRQRVWTAVMGGALGLKLALDLALIPLFERLAGNAALGAAVALVAAESAIMLTGLKMLPHEVRERSFGSHLVRLLAVAAASAAVMVVTRDRGFFLMTGAGVLTYAAAALALRVYAFGELVDGLHALRGVAVRRREDAAASAPAAFGGLFWAGARMKPNRQAVRPATGVRSAATAPPARGYASGFVAGPRRREAIRPGLPVLGSAFGEGGTQAGEILRN